MKMNFIFSGESRPGCNSGTVVTPPEFSQVTDLPKIKAYPARIFTRILNLGLVVSNNARKIKNEDEQ
jgi:hypothetical protein